MGSSGLLDAIAAVPAGAWAVGVSGGADSVALLSLLRARADLSLHVVHLDHETRGRDSTDDAAFVADLARRWSLPCTVARWRDVEPTLALGPDLNNPSARYRAGRLTLFRRVTGEHGLHGVVLAHHADDQAETVLHRLLRGSGPAGLVGMAPRSEVGGLLVLRPLLRVRKEALREYLRATGQPWREDRSNESDVYLRNRLRKLLSGNPELTDGLLELADACRGLRDWVAANAPEVEAMEVLPVATLRDLPLPLAREGARRWLAARGAPADELAPAALDRLVEMAIDAASPARQHFPGALLVGRRGGKLFIVR